MRIITAFALLLLALPASADDSLFSKHLFAKFQVKACTKCHDYFESDREGLSFKSHKGRSVEMCVVCHQKSVSGFEHQEEWFAMPGLYTSGMNAVQTCETVKIVSHSDFKSRQLLKRQLAAHLFEDPRVLWGIEGATPLSGNLPGGKREDDLVKGGFPLWKEQVNAWIDGGMKCQ